MLKNRLAVVSVLALMGASSVIAICFNLDTCPCAEISNCNPYPDASSTFYGGLQPPNPQPASAGYTGLNVTPYNSGPIDGQQTGWLSSDGFTTSSVFLNPCWSADTITWYSQPECGGSTMGTARGTVSARYVDWTYAPTSAQDCGG